MKSQIAILFILLLIFFCQKLVQVLDAAVGGEIPTNLILAILGLGVPEMAQLILPLSLFLALLMTYGRLYADSEITVMHACGFGHRGLLLAAMLLAMLTAILAVGNTFWFKPWSAKQQDKILADARANPSLAALMEGQFQTSEEGNLVLFVGDVEGNQFHNIFLAQLRPDDDQRPSIMVADNGYTQTDSDGSRTILLNSGTRYEGTALLRDFRITKFKDYRANIGYQSTTLERSDDVAQASLTQLWHNESPKARAELNWRMTLVASVFLMAIMVVPLSKTEPRQGRMLSILPAILLYLIYFLLQSSFSSNGSKGKLDPLFWIWLTNAGYLFLAILLNLWDKPFFRRLRIRLQGAS